jgi:hypothetical protein
MYRIEQYCLFVLGTDINVFLLTGGAWWYSMGWRSPVILLNGLGDLHKMFDSSTCIQLSLFLRGLVKGRKKSVREGKQGYSGIYNLISQLINAPTLTRITRQTNEREDWDGNKLNQFPQFIVTLYGRDWLFPYAWNIAWNRAPAIFYTIPCFRAQTHDLTSYVDMTTDIDQH